MIAQPHQIQERAWGAPRGLSTLERRDHAARIDLVRRVRAEFEELPGHRLTLRQASRLFGVTDDICVRLLGELVRDHIVRLSEDGRYRAWSH